MCLASSFVCLLLLVQFLPRLGDRIIATAAADAKVQIHTVETKETSQVYKCHIGRVKRLATAPNTPYLLWSASEDGTIRYCEEKRQIKPSTTVKITAKTMYGCLYCTVVANIGKFELMWPSV